MRYLSAALGALICIAGSVSADPTLDQLTRITADRKRMEAAIDAGRKQAAFCFNCHGAQGISVLPDVPNLAGQPASYLVEQIRRFGNGQRRDAFMQGLIKALPDEEKLNIALYFAVQPLKPAAGGQGDPELGKGLYVKLCQNCHGENGRGNQMTPTVAGQQYGYLVKSTQRYRDRSGERLHQEMSDAVVKMTNNDIVHVSAYLSRMR